MSIKRLSKQKATELVHDAKKIASVTEFSKTQDCEITARYFHVKDGAYLEIVKRSYTSKKVEDTVGYFLYDTPFPVIFSLLHSCDMKFHKKAESLFKKNFKNFSERAVNLPSSLTNRIEKLSEEIGCSFDLIVYMLLEQGLSSENEMLDFYENYDNRSLSLSRNSLEDYDEFVVNSKEQI